MAKQTAVNTPKPEDLTFEQATEELESIIEQIESGAIGLEESLAQRKRGEALISRCRSILDRAEQELEQVSVESRDGDDSSKPGKSMGKRPS